MKKTDFNMVTECGNHKRIIYKYKDNCYIGCFKGTRNDAVIAICNKYTGTCRDEYIDKIKELYTNDIDRLAVVTAKDNYAVKWASANGHLAIVKYLVLQGADVRTDDDCCVGGASNNGHLEMVKYLVSQGSDATAKDGYCIKHASRNGHLEVVKYLVGCGGVL